MGLLSKGTPLSWKDTKEQAEYIRRAGIEQLINVYRSTQDRKRDGLLWGDEIEYIVVTNVLNEQTGKYETKLSLKGLDIVNDFMEEELPSGNTCLWRPEFAKYMLEGTPGEPYGSLMSDFISVEDNMNLRRKIVLEKLSENEKLISLPNFPLLGVENCFVPAVSLADTEASHSIFISDMAINSHPRFATLARNIRERRGEKVAINVPIFQDENTPKPFNETLPESRYGEPSASLPDHIYMDCMCFGMGCSCLQVTFQACNIDEARTLYDQLVPMAPIMMSLSAGSPIFRGYLADTDVRWSVISAAVDDRTKGERGLEPLAEGEILIAKSRYDSVDRYISNDPRLLPEFNDLPECYNKSVYDQLLKEGFDPNLSQHFAHLFIRDPLVLYKELLVQDNTHSTDHFENIQSTNWQTVRFKPPPPMQTSIGWRVEFRSMEVQITDFENAAFVVFIALWTRTILSCDVNLYMPMSKVDENMKTAHKRNSVLNDKFYFRKNISNQTSDNSYILMTLNEIMNGKEGEFIGLIPLILQFLDTWSLHYETKCRIQEYLKLISMRASGQVMTPATWIRNFVQNHPDYKKDSKVSDIINHDLINLCHEISSGKVSCPELVGSQKKRSE